MQAVAILAPQLEGLVQHLTYLESEARDHTGNPEQRARLEGHLCAHGGSVTAQLRLQPRIPPMNPLEMPEAAKATS